MGLSFYKQNEYSYQPLHDNSSERSVDTRIPLTQTFKTHPNTYYHHRNAHHRQPPPPATDLTSHLPTSVKFVFCSLGFLLVGFFLGQSFTQNALMGSFSNRFSTSLILGFQPRAFEYNAVYGGKEHGGVAWDELIPSNGGVFAHPKIAPKGARFAVWEQLSCLNSIREAYWTTLDFALSSATMTPAKFPSDISPQNVRYCVDMMRQALMCNPDLTTLPANASAGSSSSEDDGLASSSGAAVHHCKNWEQLEMFMEKWEVVEGKSAEGEELA